MCGPWGSGLPPFENSPIWAPSLDQAHYVCTHASGLKVFASTEVTELSLWAQERVVIRSNLLSLKTVERQRSADRVVDTVSRQGGHVAVVVGASMSSGGSDMHHAVGMIVVVGIRIPHGEQ